MVGRMGPSSVRRVCRVHQTARCQDGLGVAGGNVPASCSARASIALSRFGRARREEVCGGWSGTRDPPQSGQRAARKEKKTRSIRTPSIVENGRLLVVFQRRTSERVGGRLAATDVFQQFTNSWVLDGVVGGCRAVSASRRAARELFELLRLLLLLLLLILPER